MFLTDQVLEFLGLEHVPGITPRVVATLFVVLTSLLYALALYVIYSRVRRHWSRRSDSSKAAVYQLRLFQLLHSRDERARSHLVARLRNELNNRMERGFFRRLLLQHLRSAEGDAFHQLRDAYEGLGFLEEDIRGLQSRHWWVRLGALLRKESLNDRRSRDAFLNMIKDPHELVALAALRAAGQVSHPGEIEDILDELSRRAPTRFDIFVEILRSLGKIRAPEIIRYLDTCYDPYVAAACVSILGDLRAPEAVPHLELLMKSHDDHLVARVVESYGKIGGTTAATKLRPLLAHPSEKVRVATVKILGRIADLQFHQFFHTLHEDPSAEVRRAVFEALHQEVKKS